MAGSPHTSSDIKADASTRSATGPRTLPQAADDATSRRSGSVEAISKGGSVAVQAERAQNAGRHTHFKRRLILADTGALALGVALAFLIQAIVKPVPGFVAQEHLWLTISALPAFAVGAFFNKLYYARANERRMQEAVNLFKAVGVGVSFLLLIAFVRQYNDLSRLWVAAMAVSISISLLFERRFARSIFARLRREGKLSRRIIIVGTDAHAVGLMHAYARNPSLGYNVVGFVGDDDLGPRGGIDVLGTTADLLDLLAREDAVGVVVSLASVPSDEVNTLTRRVTDQGYHVALSSSLRDIDVSRLRPQSLDGRTLIYVEPVNRGGWHASAKRAFDVSLATFIMVVTLPIQIFACFAIAFSSTGPVFFRQIRVGKDGELFEVLKFRTMYVDAEARKAELMDQNEADGPLFKMKNDPRVTPVGRVIRKLSIDELPQLFCVLIGSMSMVGPRPALPSEFEQWEVSVRERLRVLPGLTGMWQVSGRSDSSFETYKRMDLYYVDNWSLAHDVHICFRTIAVVLRGSGAS